MLMPPTTTTYGAPQGNFAYTTSGGSISTTPAGILAPATYMAPNISHASDVAAGCATYAAPAPTYAHAVRSVRRAGSTSGGSLSALPGGIVHNTGNQSGSMSARPSGRVGSISAAPGGMNG